MKGEGGVYEGRRRIIEGRRRRYRRENEGLLKGEGGVNERRRRSL